MISRSSSRSVISPLFRYPFLVPLVVLMLHDGDVLVGLLATTRAMKKVLTGYAIKGTIFQVPGLGRNPTVTLDELCKPDRYLPVKLQHMDWIRDYGLASYISLTTATFGYSGPVMFLTARMLPCSLTCIRFTDNFKQSITNGLFPDKLRELDLGFKYNKPIPAGALPESLKVLILSTKLDQPLHVGSLPSSLTSLSMGCTFNQPLHPGVFPLSLESLTFSKEWNKPLMKELLPSKLRYLHFGSHFNQFIDIDVIPNSVTELTLSHAFYQPLLPGVIPSSVTCLNYDSTSKCFLYGSLPFGLKTLKISKYFPGMLVPDFPLVDHLNVSSIPSVNISMFPISLEHLEISFTRSLNFNILPQSLLYLRLTGAFNQHLVPYMLPRSLKELHLSQYHHPLQVGTLPEHLTHFTCYDFCSSFTQGMFPDSLRHLELLFYNHPLVSGAIPFGVTDIILRPTLKRRFESDIFPASVKRLFLLDRCTASHDSIPCSVTHLKIGVVKPGVIPDSVTHLTLDVEYDDHVVVGVIPSSVTHLKFGKMMKQPVTFHTIPHSVTHLVLSPLQTIDHPDLIPPSVKYVECPFSYPSDKKKQKVQYTLPATVEHVCCANLLFMEHRIITYGSVRISTRTMTCFP